MEHLNKLYIYFIRSHSSTQWSVENQNYSDRERSLKSIKVRFCSLWWLYHYCNNCIHRCKRCYLVFCLHYNFYMLQITSPRHVSFRIPYNVSLLIFSGMSNSPPLSSHLVMSRTTLNHLLHDHSNRMLITLLRKVYAAPPPPFHLVTSPTTLYQLLRNT